MTTTIWQNHLVEEKTNLIILSTCFLLAQLYNIYGDFFVKDIYNHIFQFILPFVFLFNDKLGIILQLLILKLLFKYNIKTNQFIASNLLSHCGLYLYIDLCVYSFFKIELFSIGSIIYGISYILAMILKKYIGYKISSASSTIKQTNEFNLTNQILLLELNMNCSICPLFLPLECDLTTIHKMFSEKRLLATTAVWLSLFQGFALSFIVCILPIIGAQQQHIIYSSYTTIILCIVSIIVLSLASFSCIIIEYKTHLYIDSKQFIGVWKKNDIHTINNSNKNSAKSNNKDNSTINVLSKIPIWKEGEIYTRGMIVKTNDESIYQLQSLSHVAKIAPNKTSLLLRKLLNFTTHYNSDALLSPMLVSTKLIITINALLLIVLSIYQQRRFGYVFVAFCILIYIEIKSTSISRLYDFYVSFVNKMSGSSLFLQKSK